MNIKRIHVMDTSFRDGFQSVFGARVLTPDFLPALEAAVEAGELYVQYDQESVSKNKQEMINSGVTFIEEPDIEAFQLKLDAVVEELEKEGMWPAGLYEYIQGLK